MSGLESKLKISKYVKLTSKGTVKRIYWGRLRKLREKEIEKHQDLGVNEVFNYLIDTPRVLSLDQYGNYVISRRGRIDNPSVDRSKDKRFFEDNTIYFTRKKHAIECAKNYLELKNFSVDKLPKRKDVIRL